MTIIESNKPDKDKERKKLAKRMQNTDRVICTLRIPRNVYVQAKKKFIEKRITMTEFLNDMLLKYINK